MAEKEKDVIILKKKKTKDKKKKKKTKKKKTDKTRGERGITININVGKGGSDKAPKQPKIARGFAPKALSIRGQRGRGNLDTMSRQAEMNQNLMNNVYQVRAQAQQAQAQAEDKIKNLSSNIGILRSQLNFLGTQVLNPPQQLPPNITINQPQPPQPNINITNPPMIMPPQLPAPNIYITNPPPPQQPNPNLTINNTPPQMIEDIQTGMAELGRNQLILQEGIQTLATRQQQAEARQNTLEERQATDEALGYIWNVNDDQEPPRTFTPAPAPAPPPINPQDDPARMSSSVDPQEEEKTELGKEPQQPTLQEETVTVETVPFEEAKKTKGGQKGVAQTRYTADELNLLLGQALQEKGKSKKEVTNLRNKFLKDNIDIIDRILERGGNIFSIKNKIKGLRQEEEKRIKAEQKMMFEEDKFLIDE